ncbi:hypothetical protein ACEPUM_09730 [Pseudomonas aeruginosa]
MSHLTFPSNTPLMVRNTRGRYKPATANQILDAARDVIRQLFQSGVKLDTSKVVPAYLRDRLAMLEHEVFAVLFLDAHLLLIEYSAQLCLASALRFCEAQETV